MHKDRGTSAVNFRFSCCPCCESSALYIKYQNENVLDIVHWKQFFYGGKDFIECIISCRDCGYSFINHPEEKSDHFYNEADIAEYEQLTVQRQQYFSAVKRIVIKEGLALPIQPSILDIGAASGEWLRLWSDTATLHATEANSLYIDKLRGLGIAVSTDMNSYENQFDMISAFDLLEHVPDPRKFISTVLNRIKPGGYLILGVPDMDKRIAVLLGIRYYLWTPMHFSYFTRTSLRSLLKATTKCNPRILESPPMRARLSGILKWIMPHRRASLIDNMVLPIGYRASLIALVRVNA